MNSDPADPRVRRFVLLTCLLGVASSLTVALLALGTWSDVSPRVATSGWVVMLAVVVTTVAQYFYVRVRHGGTWEELNFYEVALGIGVLLLAPFTVLLAGLGGVLLGEMLIRREAIKVSYNLAMYAVATCAMIAVYETLMGTPTRLFDAPRPDPTTPFSLLSLFVAAGVFAIINLSLLAGLLRATGGPRVGEVLAQERRLSVLMTVGSVGIAFTAVALAEVAPVAMPFALLPALALWYAYGAAAQHAEAAVRNEWLIRLGGGLAAHGQGDQALHQWVEAIRNIVAAPEARLLDPRAGDGAGPAAALVRTGVAQGARELLAGELPDSWRTGVVVPLDLGADQPGALLLGSTTPYRRSRIAGRSRGWTLAEDDEPVLRALVAAVGSAMRAGAAFDALTEETAKLTAVVDNTSDGIAMVDETGTIRLWSRTMAKMTGVAAAGLSDVARAPRIVQSLIEASDASPSSTAVQVRLLRADGEELDVSLSTVRVREALPAAAVESPGWVRILTVHDETRERRVERMKTDFVATISHELRTPITPIKGYARLLASRGDRVSPQRRAAALQVISERADHLSRLVDDLLLASQVSESARLAVEMGVGDLRDLVRQAVDTFPSMAPRLQVTLPADPVEVQCDRFRTVQCLANLIGNAEKYAPGDSPVEIDVDVVGMHARVRVRDHGEGIPSHEREKVFERFYRREDPLTMRTGGAGLGLHIARELAVAMGGGLELHDPSEGPGAEFVLFLVTAQAPPAGGPGGPASVIRSGTGAGTKRSEDRPAHR